jgi:diguanylate cyclase (GGDEF)-like protein
MRHPFLKLILLVLVSSSCAAEIDLQATLAEARDLLDTSTEASLALLNDGLTDLEAEQVLPDNQVVFGELLELRATIQRGMGRYDLATADAERLAALGDQLSNEQMSARASLLLGSIHAEQGLYGAALELFHNARALLEDTDQPLALASIHNAIGVTHTFTGDQARARAYFERAVDGAKAAGDDRAATVYLGNLALSVAEVDGPEAALPMFREVLQANEEAGNTSAATLAKGNICDQLIRLKQYEQAEQQCLEALEAINRAGEKRWQAGIRLSLGGLRQQQGRLKEAESLYRDALRIASEAVPTLEDEILASLAEVLIDQERSVDALTILQRQLALRDQSIESDRQGLIEELEMRYKIDQTEAELELLQLQSELQATQIRQRNQLLMGMLLLLTLAVLSAIGAFRSYRDKARLEQSLARQNEDLENALEHINELARHDSLTGLLNRRALEEFGNREVSLKLRHHQPLSVVLIDLDHFKTINDRAGHAAGDEVLRAFSEVLLEHSRESDLIGRWGGEEFVALLPGTNLEDARQMVGRIQASLRSNPVSTPSGSIILTVTAGIASVEDRLDLAINNADQAMYKGKHDGRDRIVVFDESTV